MPTPLISVIAAARNAGDAIAELVRRMEAQTLPRGSFEVVIADDGSTDGSTASLATDDEWVRVLDGPPLNAYAARNRAVAATRAPLIASCDADCLPEPEWLEAGLAGFDTADIVAGLIRFVVPRHRTVWTLLDIDTFLDQEHIVRSGGAVTANLFFRRDYFDLVEGFDDTLPNGGDQEFVRRCVAAGARLELSDSAVVWHPSRDTAGLYLGKLWNVHRRFAEREGREGRRPYATRIRWWLPVLPTLRARRRLHRALGLNRRRLRDNSITATAKEQLLGALLLYGFLPYFVGLAQMVGWRESRLRVQDRRLLGLRKRSAASVRRGSPRP